MTRVRNGHRAVEHAAVRVDDDCGVILGLHASLDLQRANARVDQLVQKTDAVEIARGQHIAVTVLLDDRKALVRARFLHKRIGPAAGLGAVAAVAAAAEDRGGEQAASGVRHAHRAVHERFQLQIVGDALFERSNLLGDEQTDVDTPVGGSAEGTHHLRGGDEIGRLKVDVVPALVKHLDGAVHNSGAVTDRTGGKDVNMLVANGSKGGEVLPTVKQLRRGPHLVRDDVVRTARRAGDHARHVVDGPHADLLARLVHARCRIRDAVERKARALRAKLQHGSAEIDRVRAEAQRSVERRFRADRRQEFRHSRFSPLFLTASIASSPRFVNALLHPRSLRGMIN